MQIDSGFHFEDNTDNRIEGKQALLIEAFFSDESKHYRIPQEPNCGEEVKIRFRTAKDNVDVVSLITDTQRMEMKKAGQQDWFDYYEVSVLTGDEPIQYYFEIKANGVTCLYNKLGVVDEAKGEYSFVILPGFHTPDWAKGAVFYQIFVDRFCNGDYSNDVEDREYIYIKEGVTKVNDWDKYPDTMGVREFYGGDLQGVINKLPYLQSLGIEAIYLNPIFVSPSNHKYDVQDYEYVDPHFGKIVTDGGRALYPTENSNQDASQYIVRVTNKKNLEASNQLFAQLIDNAHELGIRVIIDGVFNHCGSFNKWLDREQIYENQSEYKKGAYVSSQSPYRSFFRFREDGHWPYNSLYDGWWGHNTLPKLNYEESPLLVNYILNIARKWISKPFCADGWRLDVAADLGYSNEYNHKFWKAFRQVVKEENPEALILAEHYGNPSSWLRGDEWDTVMNYDAFMEPITWFLTGMEKHSDVFRNDLLGNAEAFVGAMKHHMASFTGQSLEVAMNELSNHDHSRFLTRTNHVVGRTETLGPEAANQDVNKSVFKEAITMQMTWPGAPTLYYGDEAGVCGFTDPDNRRTYPWGREDNELIEFYRNLISIHKSHNALRVGSFKFLYASFQVIGYGRFDENEQIIVLVNNSDREITVDIPAWEIGISIGRRIECILNTSGEIEADMVEHFCNRQGNISLRLQPTCAVIYATKEKPEDGTCKLYYENF